MVLNKELSLVLGSGGARGYAHIGVIEELEERGYVIKSIAGSSIGSLVGVLHACSRLQEFKEWVLGKDLLDVMHLLEFNLGTKGVFKGDRIFQVLRNMFDDVLLEDLTIPVTVVATELLTQKEVWFVRGPALEAVRASTAVPGLFTPLVSNGHVFVDGGLLNPLPLNATAVEINRSIIAVNVNSDVMRPEEMPIPLAEQEKQEGIRSRFVQLLERSGVIPKRTEHPSPEDISLFETIYLTVETMQNCLTRYKIAGYPPDLTVNVPRNACTFMDFHKAYDLIALGRLITKEALDELEKKAQNSAKHIKPGPQVQL